MKKLNKKLQETRGNGTSVIRIYIPPHKRIKLITTILTKKHGKAKNPWPNVDAASGSLLYFYGLKEFNYYTVLFSISRTMGIIAQMVINRAMGIPIMRPKSVTTDWIKNNT